MWISLQDPASDRCRTSRHLAGKYQRSASADKRPPAPRPSSSSSSLWASCSSKFVHFSWVHRRPGWRRPFCQPSAQKIRPRLLSCVSKRPGGKPCFSVKWIRPNRLLCLRLVSLWCFYPNMLTQSESSLPDQSRQSSAARFNKLRVDWDSLFSLMQVAFLHLSLVCSTSDDKYNTVTLLILLLIILHVFFSKARQRHQT